MNLTAFVFWWFSVKNQTLCSLIRYDQDKMLSLHRDFWREFTSMAIQQLISLDYLCPRLTKPADFCCLGHMLKERRAVTKHSKLLCHLIEDLLQKLMPLLWPLLPLSLWNTTWTQGSWAHPLSTGAPSGGGRKRWIKAIQVLYAICSHSHSLGLQREAGAYILFLPLRTWFSASLVFFLWDVSLFEISGESPACWSASSVLRRYLKKKKKTPNFSLSETVCFFSTV